MRVKVQDVDLQRQRVKYLIMKGTTYREDYRVIIDEALPYWQQAVDGVAGDCYLFGRNKKPGTTPVSGDSIAKWWLRNIKQNEELAKLNGGKHITADFYSLKHLHTTEAVEQIGTEAAAALNAETTRMIEQHYDVKNAVRKEETLKKLKTKFNPTK